jgi:hypothetical protein
MALWDLNTYDFNITYNFSKTSLQFSGSYNLSGIWLFNEHSLTAQNTDYSNLTFINGNSTIGDVTSDMRILLVHTNTTLIVQYTYIFRLIII